MRFSQGIGIGSYGFKYKNTAQKVKSLFSRLGSNAHMYLPGAQTPALGPELVTNGTWEGASNGWLLSGASLSFYGVVSGYYNIYQSSLLAGMAYSCTVSIVVRAGAVEFLFGNGDIDKTISTTGTHTFTGTANGSITDRINIRPSNTGALADFEITNISVREILSYNDVINGFHTGNYVESTGVTPATVDQPVGLVLDAAGSVGSELAPALEAANWSVVNADATHIVTFSGGIVRYQSDTITPSLTLQKTGLLTAGKTYKVEITVSSYTSGSLKSDVSTGIIVGAAGKFTFNVQSATTAFNLYRNTTNVDLTISSISVKEITGIHASQSTSGFRPVERRGIVNLLTYSNDLTNAAWVKALGATAPSANQLALTSTVDSGASQLKTGVTVGTPVAAAVLISGTPGVVVKFMLEEQGGAYPSASQNITLTAEPTLYVLNRTTTTATSVAAIVRSLGTATTVTIGGFGLFAGTLTASQILAMGGIPMTTTAAASSSAGPYYLEHKAASTQFLTLGSNPIGATLTQPYTIVVAGIVGSLGVDRYMCGDLARAVGVSNNGLAFVVHGGNFSSGMSPVIAAGSTIVVEVTYDGSLLNVWINGVKKLTNFSLAASGSAAQPFALGQRGNNTGYWDGGLYPSFVTNSVLPDADRRLIAKQIAQLAGVTL